MSVRERRPHRILNCDLARLARGRRARVEVFTPSDGDLERAAEAGGGALGLLWLLGRERACAGAAAHALALSVGGAVVAGLPTAARATVSARAPLSGGFAEGLVGGGLGRRLARVADALLVSGHGGRADGVLVVEPDGEAHLESMPKLAGLDPRAAHAVLGERFGEHASLRIGAAGERGAPVANLASGGAEASFVGRGGLGAAFAARGLKALVVLAAEVEPARAPELVRALGASPRLLARAEDGTFELAPARAARGEIGRDEARALYDGARAAARERTGCAGCPTPCGWSFARPGADASAPARFGKLWPLLSPLGLVRFEDALELAAACDAVGVDAKETGAALALFAPSAGAVGRVERLCELVLDLGRGTGPGMALAGGAAALARSLGAPHASARPPEAPGPERGPAALLGAFVSTNGSDPMRTFPFLLEAGGRERLARVLAGVPLPPGAEDPDLAAGKGRIVWWHENLAAALDATGFCAFSAAGLLGDGVLELDALAQVLGARSGRELLEGGARLVALRRELAERLGALQREPPAALLDPALLAEYERWRALGFAAAEVQGGDAPAEPRARPVPGGPARAGGNCTLRCSGPLARRLGGDLEVELAAPTPLLALLTALAERHAVPLVRAGLPLASAYRDSRRLEAADLVYPGDALDLVVAIAGG